MTSSRRVAGSLTAFFDVTLDRIADPSVPRGCLIAQSVITSPTLPSGAAARAAALLELQGTRIRTALLSAGVLPPTADDLALRLAAVNQSLAVLSRTSLGDERLRSLAQAAVAAVAV